MSRSGSGKQRPRLIWRLLRWVLILTLVLAALLSLVLFTVPGGRLIALTVNRLGSGPQQSVEIDRVEGLLSGSTRIGHVLIKDAEGEPWLLIKGIEVDWSPLALFSSALAIDDLRIERVELARLPASSGDNASDGAALKLPLSVNIKRFRAPDILLGEAVAGRVARLEASGGFAVDASVSNALADLTVNRIDSVGGQFTIDADYARGEDRFNISANLSEPPGGVMAFLLKLAPDDAISLSATSQGSLADWRLSLDGSINNEIVASAHLSVVAGEAGEAVSFAADGMFERFLPPALSQIVEGRSSMVLEGLVEPERTGAVIDLFTFSSSRLSAEARGRVAREGQVDLKASLSPRINAPMLQFGEAGAEVSLSVPELQMRVSGNADEASLHLVSAVDRITAADFSADTVSAVVDFPKFSLASRSGTGKIDVDISAFGSANDVLARALAGRVRLSGDLSVEDGNTLASKALELTSGSATVRLADLEASAAGDIGASLSGSLRSAVLSDEAERILGSEMRFSAGLSRAQDGALTLGDIKLLSDNSNVTGDVSLAAKGELSARLDARLTTLSGLNETASGGLALSASLSGAATKPAFELALTGEDLRVQGKDLSGLRLEASGVVDPASPQADLALSGTLDGQAISGTVKLSKLDGVVRVDPLRLEVASNLISGALTLDGQYRPKGVISLGLEDIGALSSLALQSVDGKGQGTLTFDVRAAKPVLDVALTFPALRDAGFSLRDAQINLNIEDLFQAPHPSGVVDVAAISVGKTDIADLRVNFTQDQNLGQGQTSGQDSGQVSGQEPRWTNFDGKARAAGFPVALQGRIRSQEAQTELELVSGRTSYKGLAISLSGPARAVLRDGVTQIERLVISPGGGKISVAGSAGKTLAINADLSALPLKLVNALAPGAGLSGTVSGQLRVTGTGASPVVSYNLKGSGVRAAAASSIADVALGVDVSGGLRNGELSFDARAGGGGLAFTATGSVETGGSKQVSSRMKGTVPFSLLSVPLARQGLALSGAASVDLSVSGPVGSPRISGSIKTAKARLVEGRTGNAIEDLAVDIGVSPDQATIRALNGQLSTGGQISGSGSIGLRPGSGYPADLKLKIARARYADGQMVATRFDADLGLSGPLSGRPMLTGTVRLDETTISIPETLPASISQLQVTHTNAPASIEAQSERLSQDHGGGSSGGFGLDVAVQAQRIFVRGRGVDAELSGAIRLTGSTGSPRATGGFDLSRGRLAILGKRLDFDRGRLGFTGSLVPVLDFAASTRAGSHSVTVLVTGSAERPQFRFTASPDLPEDEALALLIFGRSLDKLSPVQIAQLAQAAGQLTGVVQGGGLVEQLRKATGIDDLDVRTDADTGQTSVGVGKYLNDRTYLGLEQGATAGSGKAKIDLDIGGGIKLRGEADADGKTKGGIFFERDY